MENQTLKITPPEGYEIDRENSTIDEIVFKPIERSTCYSDVARALFLDNKFYFINQGGFIIESSSDIAFEDMNNCTSMKQGEKLLALNMMMNVAKFMNDGWKVGNIPRYNKYYWVLNTSNQTLRLGMSSSSEINGNIYFKSQEAARKALEILGEDVIKTALSVDY